MNWKVNLHQNLKILSFNYKSLGSKDTENLFESPNYNGLQVIILFLMSKLDLEKHDECIKICYLTKDITYKQELIKKLHSWCMDIISKTFENITCTVNSFNKPYGNKIYEILGKASTGVLKQLVFNKSVVESQLVPIRQSANLIHLKELRISATLVLNSIKRDFVQETVEYQGNFKRLQMRKEMMHQKIQLRRLQIVKKEIELKKKENTFSELFSEMKEFLSVSGEDNDNRFDCLNKIEQLLLDHASMLNLSMDQLMSKVDLFNDLCTNIKNFSEKMNNSVKISQPLIDGNKFQFQSKFYGDGDRLRIDKLIENTANELPSNEFRKSTVQVLNDLSVVFDSLYLYLTNAREQLDTVKSANERVKVIQGDVVIREPIEQCKLHEFGGAPSIEELIRNSADLNEDDLHYFDNNVGKRKEYQSSSSNARHVVNLDNSDWFKDATSDNSMFSNVSIVDEPVAVVDNENNSEGSDVAIPERYLVQTPLYNSRTVTQTSLSSFGKLSTESRESFVSIDEECEMSDNKENIVANGSVDDGNFFDKDDDSFIESINNLPGSSDF